MGMDKETKAVIAALQKWVMAGDVALRIVEGAYGDLGLDQRPSFFAVEKEAHEDFISSVRDYEAKHGPFMTSFFTSLQLSDEQLKRLAEGLTRPYKNAGKKVEIQFDEEPDVTPTVPGNDKRH